jgi:hypothetical protein
MIVAIICQPFEYGLTIAHGLGAVRAQDGHKVLVIETQPQAPQAQPAGAERIALGLKSCFVAGADLEKKLEEVLPLYGDIVIAAGVEDCRTALIEAARAVIPVRAADAEGHRNMVECANAALMFNPGLQAVFAAIAPSGPSAPALAAAQDSAAKVVAAKFCPLALDEDMLRQSERAHELAASPALGALGAMVFERG